jgi:phage-related protein
MAQCGGKHRNARALQGLGGAGVIEIVTDFSGDTFRAVYTLRLAGAVFVLHAFQKKAKSGVATPQWNLDLIRKRLREAEGIAREMQG